MNIKKIILFLFLIFLPYSCAILDDVINSEEYPINSAWIYYFNSKQDSIIVYIDHISIIEGVVIRDTKIRNDTTIYGRTKKAFLYPIK